MTVPELILPVDLTLAGFEFHGGFCSDCGRPREAVVGPLAHSIDKPSDPLAIFTGDQWNESVGGKRLTLFCAEHVKNALGPYRLKGIEFIPVG